MRQLITNDLYKMARILKKLGLKPDDIKIDWNSDDVDQEIILALILKVVENFGSLETEINEFMGGLCDMSGEDFGKLPLSRYNGLIEEFKQLEGVKDFFERAGRLMNWTQLTSFSPDTETPNTI